MAILIVLVLTLVTGFAARAHGHGNDPAVAGSWPKWCRVAAKVWFAVLYGFITAFAFYQLGWDWLWLPVLFAVRGGIAAWALSMGHGNYWEMEGVDPLHDEPEKIEAFTRPLYEFFGGDIHKAGYSWFCMATKGFLIAGLPGIVIWPVSYFLGVRVLKDSAYAECYSGGLAGFAAAMEIILLAGIASS